MATTLQDLNEAAEEHGEDPADVEVHIGEFNHRFAEMGDDPIDDVQDVSTSPTGPSYDQHGGSRERSRLLLVHWK